MEYKEITIYDIANKIGVSPTTVSRALNNHPAVNEKTKSKILQVAEKLGYRSNFFASNLRSKKTQNVGVIVPRLNSSFQSSVIAGMEKIANETGYNLIISQSLESIEKEKTNARTMFNSRVDGLLVSLSNDTANIHHFLPFKEKGIPVIFYDRTPEEGPFSSVVIDNTQATYNSTKHLIQQGCQQIIHVLGKLDINIYANRLKGYKYALMDHDIPFSLDKVLQSDLNENSGEELAQKILQMKPFPDGILVSNDICAASCLQTLKSQGIKIPEDIAIVGFNNDMVSRMVEPKLSTTHYPGYEMGEVAMKNLISQLEAPSKTIQKTQQTVTLRSHLIIRASSLRKGK
ncbi:LacI family DNA-binding transcriptional regulator [Echinicola jeungdonensis]|uniref:LacI family DNA-binding transcriptional regulator n=1 Tax=Echinicola jeungdonensis TaxID=709343 RepID=A0ABV5J9L3_9BACT|nr:LacI family DNA-binding transcriptional regulator [Echinicola jeungdonensis]MDN3670381.1 LacI family DNA-binding transcriptional regulator [Echinicola jeungdonensis]